MEQTPMKSPPSDIKGKTLNFGAKFDWISGLDTKVVRNILLKDSY